MAEERSEGSEECRRIRFPLASWGRPFGSGIYDEEEFEG